MFFLTSPSTTTAQRRVILPSQGLALLSSPGACCTKPITGTTQAKPANLQFELSMALKLWHYVAQLKTHTLAKVRYILCRFKTGGSVGSVWMQSLYLFFHLVSFSTPPPLPPLIFLSLCYPSSINNKGFSSVNDITCRLINNNGLTSANNMNCRLINNNGLTSANDMNCRL